MKDRLHIKACELVRIEYEKVMTILFKDLAMLAFIHDRKIREKKVEINYWIAIKCFMCFDYIILTAVKWVIESESYVSCPMEYTLQGT